MYFAAAVSFSMETKKFSTSARTSLAKNHYKPMSGRQGGKAKPLKAPKKKQHDEDEDDAAFKAKQKADAAAKKAMAEKAKKGGPLVGGGIKKSGKK